MSFNYPTAAAAAGDLGGIEIARGQAAMTIGLATITARAGARIIIMAAGEGKAQVVRAAVEEEPAIQRPASSLHAHTGARMYLTHGAASGLSQRRASDLSGVSVACLDWALAHLAGVDPNAGPIPVRAAPVAPLEAHLQQPPEGYLKVETLVYADSNPNLTYT